MPDLFTAEPKERDNRFSDAKESATTLPVQPAEVKPAMVEPYLSEESEIPLAPVLRKPKYTRMHIFTAYCEMPPDVTFENQEDNERILIFLRRSFITNITWLTATILLFFFPIVLVQFFPSLFATIPSRYAALTLLFYFLLVASYFFINFITWYFNIILITDRRIVDIDFEELVYKNIAETKLTLVQDVSYTETGVIRTVIDYGDVLIQTAGTIDNFDLHAVPKPERVVNVIEDLIGRGREKIGV